MKTIKPKYFLALAGVALATFSYAGDTNNEAGYTNSDSGWMHKNKTTGYTHDTADDTTAAITPRSGTLTPQQFVTEAAAGGLKEVELGRVALEKSENADVKQFAETMIRDHSAANKRLEQIATRQGLAAPETNTFSSTDPKWQSPLLTSDTAKGVGAEMLTETNGSLISDYRTFRHLKTLSGSAFDQAYMTDMVNDHAKDISLFEAAAQNLSDPQLRRFAQSTLPTLRRHYQMAQDLSNKLSANPPTNLVPIKSTASAGT